MTMDDLRTRLADLDAVAAPDLWGDIERRASSQATQPVRPRTTWRGPAREQALSSTMLAVIAGLLVVAVGGGILIGSWIEQPTPTVTRRPDPTTPLLGCILQQGMFGDREFGAPDCELVAAKVIAHLPEARGTPFAILVRFFVCPDLCLPSRGGWRDGAVTVEYADGGEPIQLSWRGPPEAPTFQEVEMVWTGLKQPLSARVDGSGPFSFTLGHCGLDWYVDFDGSFWVPVGLVDGRASGLINAERGEMLLLGQDRVQFRGESGFTAELARFPGPKRIWICS